VGAHGPRCARDAVAHVSASFKLLVAALALSTALAIGAQVRAGGCPPDDRSATMSARRQRSSQLEHRAGSIYRETHSSTRAASRAVPRRQSLRHGVRVRPGVGDLRRAQRRSVGKGDCIVARQRCSRSFE
jgi:hypothetical protein